MFLKKQGKCVLKCYKDSMEENSAKVMYSVKVLMK